MNIGAIGVGVSAQSYRPSTGADQQLRQLEHEKVLLTQKLEQARNRFALSQSDEYKKIKRQLGEVSEQLTRLKTAASSSKAAPEAKATETAAVSDVSEAAQAQSAGSSAPVVPEQSRFDTFTRSRPAESAGIYSVSRNENGERLIEYDKNRGLAAYFA